MHRHLTNYSFYQCMYCKLAATLPLSDKLIWILPQHWTKRRLLWRNTLNAGTKKHKKNLQSLIIKFLSSEFSIITNCKNKLSVQLEMGWMLIGSFIQISHWKFFRPFLHAAEELTIWLQSLGYLVHLNLIRPVN